MKRKNCLSVGAIVKNNRGQYLVLYRLKYPRGLAFPAGHVERGEEAVNALKRELLEETGIKAKEISAKLCLTLKNNCSRGAKRHKWYIFEISEYAGKPRRREKNKHAFVKFMSPKKIREYLKTEDIDPAWAEIFKKFRIISKSKTPQ